MTILRTNGKTPRDVIICLDRGRLSPNAAKTVHLFLHDFHSSVLRAA